MLEWLKSLFQGQTEESELAAYLKSKNATQEDIHFWIAQFEEQKRLINHLTMEGNVVQANWLRQQM